MPEPLVAILHIGYLFLPVGFLLLALGILRPHVILPSGALHAWTAGAVGVMTLAVMTRASLGHTGKPLTATWPIQTICIASIFSALARIVTGFGVARDPMLHLSASAWTFAFAGFAAIWPPARAPPRNLICSGVRHSIHRRPSGDYAAASVDPDQSWPVCVLQHAGKPGDRP